MGKTSLIAEWSAARDDVTVVELDRIGRDEDVVGALVSALDLGAVDVTVNAVVERLAGERGTIVMDNCEHVISGVRSLVEELTARCPNLTIVASSRQMLGSADEMVVPLGPLDTTSAPQAHGDAVQVFLNRSRRVDPRFELAEGELATISSICRRLDGLPLGIELAASRVGALSVSEIDRHLDQALDLLADAASPRERHQTLRATVAWSFELLEPDTKKLVPALSVFAGGFTVDAVRAMGGGPAAVAELVDGGLALRLHGEVQSRYRLFEATRQFAAEELTDRETAERHRDEWIGSLIIAVEADHGCEREVDAVERIRADLPNIANAVAHSLKGDANLAAEIGAVLGRFAPFYGTAPMYELIDEIADHPDVLAATRGAGAVAAAAHNAWMRGGEERASTLATAALAHLPAESPDAWMANFAKSFVALRRGRHADGLHTMLMIERDESAPTWAKASAVCEAARWCDLLGDRVEAERLIEVGRRLVGACRSPSAIAHATMTEGGLYLFDDPGRATELFGEAASIARRGGARALAVMAETGRLTALVMIGRHDIVVEELPLLLSDVGRHGSWSYLWVLLRAGAEALAGLGHHEPAAQLLAAACGDPSAPATGVWAEWLDASRSTIRAACGGETWDRAVARAESAIETGRGRPRPRGPRQADSEVTVRSWQPGHRIVGDIANTHTLQGVTARCLRRPQPPTLAPTPRTLPTQRSSRPSSGGSPATSPSLPPRR